LDVSHLRSNLPVVKKSKLRKQKESSNNTGKQKESPGFKPWSNQKMPLVNLGETSRKVTSHPKDLNLQPTPGNQGERV